MKLGFVGLGLMGNPMAQRLLGGGHTLFVTNRTKEKATALLDKGAVWCNSPSDVARRSEIAVTMLSTPDVLEQVALGNQGILQGAGAGLLHVDCSTVSPVLTRSLYERYKAKQCEFLHSPVLGSVPNATDGSLLLFAGGDKQSYERAEGILRLLGSKIWRFDRVDQASNTKLLCNFFIASMISGLAQGLVFAEKKHIDPKVFLDILAHSSLNAPTYQTKGSSMVDDNFAPRFFVEHMLKDVRLVLESADESGVSLPSADVALDLYSKAQQAGFGKEDYSAVIKILRAESSGV